MDINNIYDDIENDRDLGSEVEKLQLQNKTLQDLIQSLESDIEKLCNKIKEMKKIQDNLAKNISELFRTAKAELERKDRTITDLRRELDNIYVKRNRNPTNPRLLMKRERDYSPHYVHQEPFAKKMRPDNENKIRESDAPIHDYRRDRSRSNSSERYNRMTNNKYLTEGKFTNYKREFNRKRNNQFRYSAEQRSTETSLYRKHFETGQKIQSRDERPKNNTPEVTQKNISSHNKDESICKKGQIQEENTNCIKLESKVDKKQSLDGDVLITKCNINKESSIMKSNKTKKELIVEHNTENKEKTNKKQIEDMKYSQENVKNIQSSIIDKNKLKKPEEDKIIAKQEEAPTKEVAKIKNKSKIETDKTKLKKNNKVLLENKETIKKNEQVETDNQNENSSKIKEKIENVKEKLSESLELQLAVKSIMLPSEEAPIEISSSINKEEGVDEPAKIVLIQNVILNEEVDKKESQKNNTVIDSPKDLILKQIDEIPLQDKDVKVKKNKTKIEEVSKKLFLRLEEQNKEEIQAIKDFAKIDKNGNKSKKEEDKVDKIIVSKTKEQKKENKDALPSHISKKTKDIEANEPQKRSKSSFLEKENNRDLNELANSENKKISIAKTINAQEKKNKIITQSTNDSRQMVKNENNDKEQDTKNKFNQRVVIILDDQKKEIEVANQSKNEKKSSEAKIKRRRSNSVKDKEVIMNGDEEASDRVLRSATRKIGIQEKCKSPTNILPMNELSLTHDGEIPVLHISDNDNSHSDKNLFENTVLNLEHNTNTSTPTQVNDVNMDLLREDLNMSSLNDSDMENSSKNFDNTVIQVSTQQNCVKTDDPLKYDQKVVNTSSLRRRRRVIFTMAE